MQSQLMSSKERMLSAINFWETDYIPCCFMIFKALRSQCKDEYEYMERQLEFGLDVRVNLPEFNPRFHSEVTIKDWKEHPAGEKYPLLYREYQTPEGKLSVVVNQVEDWPYGNHLPLFDDYVTPRSEKYLITEKSDLRKLKYLFLPPSEEEIRIFRKESKMIKRYASDKGFLVCGGWNSWMERKDVGIYGINHGVMGIDALMWLCGAVAPLYWAYDEPGFLEELIEIIDLWNKRRMEIYLDEGVDLLIKRAWYESTEFWSPALYKRFISPILKKDVELTQQAGARFGYIITSAIMPLIEEFIDIGIDVIIGVDPVQGKGTELEILKEKLDGKICLWGGVSGPLTIEKGTENEVRTAVENALRMLSKNSGFVLSPVDNVREDTALTWKNVDVFIDSWKDLRG
ncbi:uroporphyrinogen decarboxylase family protein [candidate division KSB1 bacterium]